MKLRDYNMLAYEFAIRNPRVIDLLGMELNEDVVKELLTFGIDVSSVILTDAETISCYSLQELYLDYEHLSHLNHVPYSPYGEGLSRNEETFELEDSYMGNKILIQPSMGNGIFTEMESDEDAVLRINSLIETRGGKLERLVEGTPFEHYDAVTFSKKSVYSLDPSRNTAKTIRKDVKFISEWISPEKYLQLLPQYIDLFDWGK